MLKDVINYIIKGLGSRKLRAYLTMIGIVIGVTAIISLMTLGDSLETGLTGQLDKLGARRVFIAGKSFAAFGPPSGASVLTPDDKKTVEKLPFLEFVAAMYSDVVEVEYNRKKEAITVFAPEIENVKPFFKDVGRELREGRFIEKEESGVVMLGARAADDFFDKEVPLKGSIKIDGVKFRVVGIFEEEGNQQNDYAFYIPIDDLRKLKDNPDAISGITAQVAKGYDVDTAATKIERALERARGDENFIVTNPKQIKEQTQGILGIVNWVVLAIAGISLLVGGLGIMNSMYTSVLERTREIGVMKAVGARNSDIMLIYLIESGAMGLIGGAIGIMLGLLISLFAVMLISATGFVQVTVDITWQLIVFGLAFSFGLGVISGVLPARRASRLKPVDALRYE